MMVNGLQSNKGIGMRYKCRNRVELAYKRRQYLQILHVCQNLAYVGYSGVARKFRLEEKVRGIENMLGELRVSLNRGCEALERENRR